MSVHVKLSPLSLSQREKVIFCHPLPLGKGKEGDRSFVFTIRDLRFTIYGGSFALSLFKFAIRISKFEIFLLTIPLHGNKVRPPRSSSFQRQAPVTSKALGAYDSRLTIYEPNSKPSLVSLYARRRV
jgi:hypothetical protein